MSKKDSYMIEIVTTKGTFSVLDIKINQRNKIMKDFRDSDIKFLITNQNNGGCMIHKDNIISIIWHKNY